MDGAVACPACEDQVPIAEFTIGDLLECPACRAGFRVQVESSTHLSTSQCSAEGPAPSPALLAKYEVLGVLGRGGQGTVYRVRPRGATREYALKFESAAGTDSARPDPSAELDHVNIVGVFATGLDAGYRYSVYEIVDGKPLKDAITGTPMPADRIVDIALQLSLALAQIHARGVIHCDIKPANILLTPEGQAKLADFGISRWVGKRAGARAAEREPFVGTPAYAAPEQIEGSGVTPATDIYAMGVMLYEMSTGRLPFRAPSLEVLLYHQVSTEPPDPLRHRPDLPPALAAVIMKCLQKTAAARPPTAESLRRQLEPIAHALGVPVPLELGAEPFGLQPLTAASRAILHTRLAWLTLVTVVGVVIPFASPRIAFHSLILGGLALAALIVRTIRDTGRSPLELVDAIAPSALVVLFLWPMWAVCLMISLLILESKDVGSGLALFEIAYIPMLALTGHVLISDALATESRALEERGLALLAFSGPVDVAVRVDGAPPRPPPLRQRARVGSHVLQLEAAERLARYRVALPTPGLYRLDVGVPDGAPRASRAAPLTEPAEAPYRRLVASVAICAVILGVGLIGMLRATGVVEWLGLSPEQRALARKTKALRDRETELRAALKGSNGTASWPALAETMIEQGQEEQALRELLALWLASSRDPDVTAALARLTSHMGRTRWADTMGPGPGFYVLAKQLDPETPVVERVAKIVETYGEDEAMVYLALWLADQRHYARASEIAARVGSHKRSKLHTPSYASMLCATGRRAEGLAVLHELRRTPAPGCPCAVVTAPTAP